jgi:hypothetical protein
VSAGVSCRQVVIFMDCCCRWWFGKTSCHWQTVCMNHSQPEGILTAVASGGLFAARPGVQLPQLDKQRLLVTQYHTVYGILLICRCRAG